MYFADSVYVHTGSHTQKLQLCAIHTDSIQYAETSRGKHNYF